MATGTFTTASVDYLQRCLQAPGDGDAEGTSGALDARRVLRVRGVGRPLKEADRREGRSEERWRPPTTGLITGLYGYRIPLAFRLAGGPDGIRVELGTWSTRTGTGEAQDRRVAVLESVLRGIYPFVAVERVPDEAVRLPLSGLALGVPAPAGVDELDGATPIDRVIRSLAGSHWEALVLAYPVAEGAIATLRAQMLNEVRAVEAAAHAEGAPSPLAEQYVELLKLSLLSLGEGLATGSWRTGVYLLGDGESYPKLATTWRSVFSGERSLPEPVRVFDRPDAESLARTWTLPDLDGAPGPGHYRRPFELQSLLTTSQLAACVHLPQLETPGFSVDLMPRFDSVAAPASRDAGGVAVGRVLHQRRETSRDYRVSLRSLTRHAFIAGTTGSGKTNTVFSLLQEADRVGIPFLVLEPAKTEYRALIEHPTLGDRVRVFTPGKATVGPLLLNPFEVPPGTTVSEHLDLIRAAFGAAFGMWTPLPQILERCLHAVYADRGWDLRTNENVRLAGGSERADAFPTLADLVAKAAEVIPSLGYDEKISGDMYAALTTRLESLRTGGKGAMLDVARSLPIADLLAHPTVIELEGMGDEGDKAFLAGLILIRLAEHRRAQGQVDELVHLLVVEEAHRLLANIPTGGAEELANPRGQAVETFSNLLSEIRAYGQGVIIADQVPVRLAPDVIKNTTLKIAHRMVSADDRAALGAAMAMEDAQTRALTTLGVGEAAVFGAGDDAPLLVQVPLAKNPLAPTPPRDEVVAAHMSRWRAASGPDLFLSRPFCAETCAGAPGACEAARQLMDEEYVQRTLSRTILSAIDEAGALDRLWEDFVGVVRARRPVTVAEPALLRALAGHGSDWLAGRRGAQGMWSYADTATFRDDLRRALLAQLGGDRADAAQWLEVFRATAMRMHARDAEPYSACALVCTQEPPLCLYRAAVADLVTSGRYRPAWEQADLEDARSDEGRRQETWDVCQDAAYELVEFPDPDMAAETSEAVELAARRVCLCFEQQMLAADRTKVPRTSRRILARVLREAGL
jgi:Helicase HerA, central domain